MPTRQKTGTTTLADLFSSSFTGLSTAPERIDADRPRLVRRLRREARRPDHETLRFHFDESYVISCNEQPFDVRWCYANDERDRVYREQLGGATDWLAIDAHGISAPFIARNAVHGGHLRLFPMQCITSTGRTPNLTREARQHAVRLGCGETEIFHHTVAVLAADAHAIMSVPLPDSAELIRFSAVLGYRIASLYGEPSTLALRRDDQELRWIGTATRVGKEARMLRGSVLSLSDWWDAEGRIVVREYDDEELVALSDHARANGMTTGEVIDLLGARTCDVYLNDKAYWRNVPQHVWNYSHGESPVLLRWLRDRCSTAIGRALLRDEVSQFASVSRRIAALLLMAPALTRNLAALT
ncbi:MAG: hypothetical protein QOI24_3790 [Acidobacteriota bacterium]|jgi:hypothetical protein|nr:hypothetical protein [Acidobacteriota bacterium]